MASPESNRTGGPRGGAGVKGLLAMFEKSTSSGPGSPAPGNGTTTNPASRDQSPAPRPLGRVRTSFVAVTGNSGGMVGLQKVPVSPSVTSPTVSFPEGQKLSGEALEALGKEQAAIDKMDETAEAIDRMTISDEPNVKKEFGFTNGHPTAPKEDTVTPAGLLPAFEKAPTKKEELVTEKSPEPVPMPNEQESQHEEQAKPVKEDLKPKPAAVKAAPPRSPTKPTSSNKTTKAAAANKSGKTLTLPQSKSNIASPLPSPAFPPKSPVRSAASASSSASRTKPTTPAISAAAASTRTRTGASASTTTVTSTPVSPAPKPRPATTAAKAKVSTAPKTEITKPARELTKPPTIRSSAFAPTAASAAKLAADQKAAAARSRPPSSASVRNRSPPGGSVVMRRGNSGTGSSRPGRKEQRSPQRPQTSAAIRNTNRSSVGSLASIAPSGAGSDFLSRMMRPTTASAGKVLDKKPGTQSKRSASVTSTSRRREPSLPPSTARLQKQRTGEKKLDGTTAKEIVPEVNEPTAEIAQEIKVGETPEESIEVALEQAPIVELPVANQDEAGVNEEDEEDEGQSPTTTASSTTLVHESEGKDDGEESVPLVKD